jgi:hypothetical protein
MAPRISTVVALAALFVVSGCDTRRDTPATTAAARERDSVPGWPLSPVTVESHGSLATRREAQDLFDRAHAAHQSKDVAAESAALRGAADFLRAEAADASGEAKAALEGSAAQLDQLATRAGDREQPSMTLLVRAISDAHGAEALHHLQRARMAMSLRFNVCAGEELLMSVDHLERAIRDLGQQSDSAAQRAIATARSLALEMTKGMTAVPDEERHVSEEIDGLVQTIHERASRKP